MRTLTYEKYKKILNDNNKIELKQQLFLQKYAKDNHNKIKNFLLFHGIGTGKNRSSILMAEEIMKLKSE